MVRTKSKPRSSSSANASLPLRRNSNKFPKILSCLLLSPDESNLQYYIGNISLGTTNNVLPIQWSECKVTFSQPEETDYIILKMFFDVDTVVLVKIATDESYIKDIIFSKLFVFRFLVECDHLIAQLYITRLPLVKFTVPIGNVTKLVFSKLLKTDSSVIYEDKHLGDSTSESLSQFYKNIREVQVETYPKSGTDNIQHPFLKVVLRPYQQEAVKWMLLREQFPKNKEMLHPLFEEITLNSGMSIYFNKYTGYIDNTKPIVASLRTGGILADEMGLGKTVEVLACILLSPKPDNDSFNVCESPDDSPTILVKSKKRKFTEICDPIYTNVNKTINVSPDLKKSKKTSNLRLCLNMWYDSKLTDVMVNKPKATIADKREVYCICGNTNMSKNAVQCVVCLKYQHGKCLGYKESFGEYRCPNCWIEQPLLDSKATLIVCPISLRTQWCDEICKHVSGLRILDYQGSKATPVYPIELLEYDIVITTYAVLQSEFRLSESTKVCNFRHARRYSAQGSPLSRIAWWRLCLDEAQMVEVPSSVISIMAKKLNAQHRWAVTGTPITRDVSGLYGLIDYLQLEPYNEFDTWKHMLYSPYKQGNPNAMFKFLSQIMWRRSKEEVINQIGIPPQRTIEYPLEFSAVESFFYRKEHSMSASDFKSNIRKSGIDSITTLKSLDRTLFNYIMAPLLNIRQACNSANVTRGRYLVTRKQVTSIKDLLDALLTKNLNFCEETLRLLVSTLNGIAGISLLSDNPVKAVAEYRKVLQLASRFHAEDTKKGLAVDKLQLIHAMHNLSEVLDTAPPVEPTLRDSVLRTECTQLKEKYLEKYVGQCWSTYEESEAATSALEKLEKNYISERGLWYASLLEWISVNRLFPDLAQRIFNAATNANIENLSRFSDERDLLYLIGVWDDDTIKLRRKSFNLLSTLYKDTDGKLVISDELVQSAMNCHLRPDKNSNNKSVCNVCKVSRHMRKYEAQLFEMTQNEANDDEDISNKGSWKPTWAELVLRVLVTLAKAKNAEKAIIKDGDIYINALDVMKKEFKLKRKFWTYLHQLINALDEINMCIIRLSFKAPEEQKNESLTERIVKRLNNYLNNQFEMVHYIEPEGLEYQAMLLHSEMVRSSAELDKRLGTFKYLETLHCQQYAGQAPDPCPICKNEFQSHWSILPCGHSYCFECIDVLIKRSVAKTNITCCVCRESHRILDISYIRNNTDSSLVNDEIRIKGEYSTKIEAIVKLVLSLKKKDTLVKILIFSTWVEVLAIIRDALKLNEINCEVMFSNTFKNNVNNFKDTTQNVTALLLPIQLGSKGLNFIEATHVILVEPLLNPGDELQAVGRVHRIGQTKPTTVHKFIIQHTIEENIHKAIAANADTWGSNKYTVGELISLFATDDETILVDAPET